MKRLWLGVVLTLWASVIAPLLLVQPAYATGEKYVFTDANTIHATEGAYDPLPGQTQGSKDFKKAGNEYEYNTVGPIQNPIRVYISNLQKRPQGGYTATLNAPANSGLNNPDTSIVIEDPNNVGPPAATTTPTPTTPPPGGNEDDDTPEATCDAGGFTIIICGIIQLALGAMDWIRESIIVPFLEQEPLVKSTEQGAAVYKVWSAFRNVATGFFILIFFLTIFGTALGFDNYTIKKILPRLVAGAILVPLSWYICVLLIDISNILGQGILVLTGQLIPDPQITFHTNLISLFLTSGTIGLIGAGVVGAIATISGGVIITILLGLLALFLTLVLRDAIILILVVASPFGLLAWILPNTQRWFTRWWNLLVRFLLLYPIMMIAFEAGRFLAYIIGITRVVQPDALANPVVAFASQHPIFAYANHHLDTLLQLASTPLNTNVIVIVQIVSLYGVPVIIIIIVIPWALKSDPIAGSLFNGLDKIKNAANSRYGRGSERDLRARENSQRQALLNEKRNEDKGNNLRAALWRARSGYGTGFGGMMKGQRNVGAMLRRNAALSKARDEVTAYRANARLSRDTEQESLDERLDQMEVDETKRLAADRGRRKGAQQREREAGNDTAGTIRSAYDAAFEQGRLGAAEEFGKQQALINATRAQPLHSKEVSNAFADLEGLDHVKARAQLAGSATAGVELDRETLRARGVPETPENMRAARMERLRSVAAASTSLGKQAITDKMGAVGRTQAEADAEQEHVAGAVLRAAIAKGGKLTKDEEAVVRARASASFSARQTSTMAQSAALEARQAAATEMETRDARVRLEQTSPESARYVRKAANLEASGRLAQEKTDRIERVKANDPNFGGTKFTDQELIEAAAYDSRNNASQTVSNRTSNLRMARTDANRVRNNMKGSPTDAQVQAQLRQNIIDAGVEKADDKRAHEIYEREGILTSRTTDRNATRAAMIKDAKKQGIVNPKFSDAEVDARRLNEQVDLGAEHVEVDRTMAAGARRTSLKAAHTELETIRGELTAKNAKKGLGAPTDEDVQAEYKARLIKAGGTKGRQETNQKIGQRQGLVDATKEQNDDATDQLSARIGSYRGEVTGAADRRGVITGQREAEQRLIDKSQAKHDRALAKGKTPPPVMTAEEARDKVTEQLRQSAEFQGQKKSFNQVTEAEGVVRGATAAENKARRQQLRNAEEAEVANAVAANIAAGGDGKLSRADVKKAKTQAKMNITPLSDAQARRQVLRNSADAMSIKTARQFMDTAANDNALVTDEQANYIDDVDRIEASQRQFGKSMGANAGDLRGANKAAVAEARRDNLIAGSTAAQRASTQRAARASAIDATKRYSEAFANEQAKINVDNTNEGRVTAEDIAEKTETESTLAAATAASDIKGALRGQRDEKKKLNQASLDAGKGPLTDEQITQQLVRDTAKVGAHNARIKAGKQIQEIQGGVSGIDQAVKTTQEFVKERDGKDISAAEAADVMYDELANTASRTGHNKIVGEVGEGLGIQVARAQQQKAALIDIAREEGTDLGDLSDAQIEAKVGAAEYQRLKAAAANRIEQAAHQKTFDDAREKVIESTGQELGHLRGEEASIAKETDRLITEAAKGGFDLEAETKKIAAATGMSLDEARVRAMAPYRNQARQNRATDKVLNQANTADVARTTEAGKERNSVRMRQTVEDHERNTILAQDKDFTGQDVTLHENHTLANDATLAKDTAFTEDVAIGSDLTAAEDTAIGDEILATEDIEIDDNGKTKVIKAGTMIPAGSKIKAGSKIPAGSKIKAGNKISAGAVLKAGTEIKAGTTVKDTKLAAGTRVDPDTDMTGAQFSQAETRQRIIQKGVAAGGELADREQSAAYGRTEALSQAALSAPDAKDRYVAAAQNTLETLAGEAAATEVFTQLAAPGKDLYRSYADSRDDAERAKMKSIFDDRVNQAKRSVRQDLFGNVPIEQVELSTGPGGNVPKLKQLFIDSVKARDFATAAAAGARLSGSNGGFSALDEARREVLGGNDYDLVGSHIDPEIREMANLVWTSAAATSNNLDAKKPIVAVTQSVSAEAMTGMGTEELRRNMRLLEQGPKEIADLVLRESAIIRDPGASAEQVRTAMENIDRFTGIGMKISDLPTQAQRDEATRDIATLKNASAPQAEVDAAQTRLTKLIGETGLLDTAADNFSNTVVDAIDGLEKGTIKKWDNNAFRALLDRVVATIPPGKAGHDPRKYKPENVLRTDPVTGKQTGRPWLDQKAVDAVIKYAKDKKMIPKDPGDPD